MAAMSPSVLYPDTPEDREYQRFHKAVTEAIHDLEWQPLSVRRAIADQAWRNLHPDSRHPADTPDTEQNHLPTFIWRARHIKSHPELDTLPIGSILLELRPIRQRPQRAELWIRAEDNHDGEPQWARCGDTTTFPSEEIELPVVVLWSPQGHSRNRRTPPTSPTPRLRAMGRADQKADAAQEAYNDRLADIAKTPRRRTRPENGGH
ncbi:hypothetical protein [Nocardia sp. NPDC052566]|uniref:hypothetical protein n=1 Tax=Nocardia sp. NPDC052566 TaxID=3364330 RepID=UPI0037CC1D29